MFLFSRYNIFFQDVLFSDHPRVLLATTERTVFTVDLRASDRPVQELYTLPKWDRQSNESLALLGTRIYSEHMLKQMHALSDRLSLLVSDRFLFVLDQRAPLRPLVESAHSICHGPDLIASISLAHRSAPLPGRVMPVFALKQEVANELQLWNVFEHAETPGQVSTVDAMRRLPSLGDCLYQHGRCHETAFPLHRASRRRSMQHTRAIYLHPLLPAGDNRDALLFRMADDGCLWFEQLHADRLFDGPRDALRRSEQAAARWAAAIPMDDAPVRELVGYGGPKGMTGEEWAGLLDAVTCRLCIDDLPLDTPITGADEEQEPSEPIRAVDERCLISDTVLSCWH